MDGPGLRIRLLGEFDLRLDGATLPPLESARARSLLAYLLLHRDAPQPRQRIAFLLWPDSTEGQAQTNLRHLLHNLRRSIPNPDQFLDGAPRSLRWRPGAPFWLDVSAFEDALSRAEGAGDGIDIEALREAADAYGGDLLEGCYDEWLLGERERLRRRYLSTLERLTAALEAQGRHAEAIAYAEELLRHDPLHEESYRLLMRLHDARGDRARALRVYHTCAATLERELGIEPSAETREAYEALLPARREAGGAEPSAGRSAGPSLVGRTPEWKRLTALWRATEARGGAHFALVSGEPGIGKTRLVDEFRSWCAHRGATTAEARSYQAEGSVAFGPVAAWLRSEGLSPRLRRLDSARLGDLVPLLPELLSEFPDLRRLDPLPEGDQRLRLFDAAARALHSAGGPILLVADDLQWCDRETLQFLHYLLRSYPASPLMVAATARREETDQQHGMNDLLAGLQSLGVFTEIELDRLTAEETASLAQAIAGHPLGEEVAHRLFRETEGNPLFVVEASRAGWDRGAAGRDWTTPRVQSVIESRLGRLSEPARELVGLAATIGRDFTPGVLAAAGELDDGALVRGLDELWRRRIVRERGAEGYDFSHDKIREVAYQGLSPARRRHHHLRIAHALERLHPHDPGPVSGQIAAHLERAGMADQASTWYLRAAEAAQRLYANLEAIRLLNLALGLVAALPPTPDRDARELQLLAALPGPLGSLEGYASERMLAAQHRAGELAQRLGLEPPPLLRSMAVVSLAQGDFLSARRAGERLRAKGERDRDDVLLVEGSYVLGIVSFWSGELLAARSHFEEAVEGYRPEHRYAHLLRYGQDPKVLCLSRLANTMWFLGHARAAMWARDEAAALAEAIGHPYSRSTALTFSTILALDMGDRQQFLEQAAMFRASRTDDAARQTRIGGEIFDGYLEVLEGRKALGVARIRRALEESRRGEHAPGQRAMVIRVLLEACMLAGEMEQGLAVANEALATGGIRLWEAESRRFRAGFLAALAAPAGEIDRELLLALRVAESQGARMFQLRAATSLLRHRMELRHGVGEARKLLAAAVEGLPEARDVPEVREAVSLLGGYRAG